VNRVETLAWLSELQRRFGAALRTPLDAGSGVLQAAVAHYELQVCQDVTAASRLAIYNRQYWFRLFGVLHNELPLTARLFGFWFFNHYAMRYLRAHPPRHHDIGRIAADFEAFLAEDISGEQLRLDARAPSLPRAAILEAARLDATFRQVFLAPEQARFQPSRAGIDALGSVRLQPSAAYARFEEHWPLVRLRASLFSCVGEAPVPLPAPLSIPQAWVLFRNAKGVAHIALERRHARLLALLESLPIEAALCQLEAECSEHERAGLPALVEYCFAQGVELGFWCGTIG
jgi:hypothetical protein